MRDPVIVEAVRTPVGTAGKGLGHVDAVTLASTAMSHLVERLDRPVGEVYLGNCMGPGGNIARVATLAAGLGDAVPALSVDRQCASGLAAIEQAIRGPAGSGVVLAGGVESASTAPWRFWPPTADGEPVRYTRAPFAPPDRDPDMGLAADLLAENRGVTRNRQDEYAARSHARAADAQARGAFDAEIVPVGGVHRDERIRRGISAEVLARFPPTFRANGTVTIGNSCGVNDGAAVVAIADGPAGPGLRVIAAASAGVDPTTPGLGLVPAVQRVLADSGLGIDDVDVWEINEAFAGQVLACVDELGLPEQRMCRDGGALAIGHPWGASGAVLVVRLFTQMVREGSGRYGIAAIAAGGGQGTAVLVESCH
ncbi:thiolase family protein [Oryzobacter terrae]|uniref:thiolase family protein n=1 Tax=Oryzobacter terrae TaxID=1620385 RepID=UPI0036716F9D